LGGSWDGVKVVGRELGLDQVVGMGPRLLGVGMVSSQLGWGPASWDVVGMGSSQYGWGPGSWDVVGMGSK